MKYRLTNHISLWNQVVRDNHFFQMIHERIWVANFIFGIAFFAICLRLLDLMFIHNSSDSRPQRRHTPIMFNRADIVDRNGSVLATHLVTGSVYVNPKQIQHATQVAKSLIKIFPHLSYQVLIKRLKSKSNFAWIVRHIPPRLQQEINNMGIPGLYIQKDEKRVYPYSQLVSHAIGYCGVDNDGLSGIEKRFDGRLKTQGDPLQLSLDIRVQNILFDELGTAITHFRAQGGNAMVMDIKTGELYGMVSFPAFDPNKITIKDQPSLFNRNTQATFEPGSIWKIFNSAIALDTQLASLSSPFDATHSIKIGRHTVNDFKGKNRVLTLCEAVVYSSNIGSIRISDLFGKTIQKDYLKRLGMFEIPFLEIPEVAAPQIPKVWSEATRMSVSYGYGMAVTPLHNVNAISTMLNDGYPTQATLLKRDGPMPKGIQVFKKDTSQKIRRLMRLVTIEGSGKQADIPGYNIMTKTGTAYKSKGKKGYGVIKERNASIVAAFPEQDPRFVVWVTLDDPKPTDKTYGYATAGWNSAPTSRKIIERIAPMLNVEPNFDHEKPQLISWVQP
jgi:cell division protein FtsI (penicillin-binding protein 3)